MTIRFILGRSGSGKTRWCINAIAEALRGQGAEPLVLLTPEQATFQAERAILSCPGIAGYNRLQVLSFNRLQYWLCKGSQKKELSALGRQMLTVRALGLCRDRLETLKSSASHQGLAASLGQLFSRLHEDNCTPEFLEQTAAQILAKDTENPTGRKFADIAVVFAQYLDLLNRPQCDFLNPDALLTEARSRVKEMDFLKNARLWVDGFSGFTLQQRDVLFEMLSVCSEANIALCLDPEAVNLTNTETDNLDPLSLFTPTEQTYTEMLAVLKRCKIRISEPILLRSGRRFERSNGLQTIERCFFSDENPHPVSAGDSVKIYGFADARAEAFFAARTIRNLVRSGQFRYRDCAVIVPQLDGYAHYLAGACEQYGIPCFLDRPQNLRHHPFIELLTASLEAIQSDFDLSGMTALLKNELHGLGRMEADILDNYCRAYGITGGDWISDNPWDFGAHDSLFDTSQIDSLRKTFFTPLKRLADGLNYPQGAITAKDCVAEIWTFLEALKVHNKLAELAEKKENSQEQYHQRVWNKTIEVFDEICRVFEGQAIASGEMIKIVLESLLSLTLKIIPPTADQVLIGSIERSRHPDIKVAVLTGLTGKLFPVPLAGDELLTEQDCQLAMDYDLPLTQRTEQALSARRYLAYIALTRASQKMYLTFPLLDEKGGAVGYWPQLDRLCSLFGDLKIQYSDDMSTQPQFQTVPVLAEWFCKTLGPQSAADEEEKIVAAGALSCCKGSGDTKLIKLCGDVEYALAYRNEAAISRTLAERWIQWPMKASESRLGTFAACPFRHFAKYGLSLQYRDLLRLEPVDIGEFYHSVLSRLFEDLHRQKEDWTTTAEAELLRRCETIARQLQQEEPRLAAFFRQSEQNRYILGQAVERLRQFIPAMRDLSAAGKFRQQQAEAKFGDTSGSVTLKIEKDKSICLIGRIDRIDCADVQGQWAGIVFDYKTTVRKMDWSKFYHGLDMQLAVYLLGLQNRIVNGRRVEFSAGAFFLAIETGLKSLDIAKDGFNRPKPSLKARGLFNGAFAGGLDTQCEKNSAFYSFGWKEGEPYSNYGRGDSIKPEDFTRLLGHTQAVIQKQGASIAQGDIRVYPYRLAAQSPCSQCEYKPMCKFDWQLNEYRFLSKVGKKQMLEELGGGNDQ